MSIESTLRTAFNALNLNQKGVQVVTENISNKDVEGYSRRIMEEKTVYASGQNLGPEVAHIRRIVDQYVVKELQKQNSEFGNIQALSDVHEQLQQIYGIPGSDQSLTYQLNHFQNTVQQLVTSPESAIYRQQMIQSGIELTGKIRNLASSLTEIRTEMDRKIAEGVQFINQQLDIVSDCNQALTAQNFSNYDSTLLDQRDVAVLKISEYINIKSQNLTNNQIDLRMGGKPLLGFAKAHHLEYHSATLITPDMTITNGQIQPITLSEYAYDCMGDIQSGKLAGWIGVRDQEIPGNLQAQLDQLAEVIRDQVNRLSNLGTSYPASATLTSNRTFVPQGGTTPFSGSGVLRLSAINTNEGTFADTLSLDLSTVTTVNDLINYINTGTNWTSGSNSISAALNTNNQLVLTATQTGQGIGITSLNGTNAQETTSGSGFSHFFGFNDFFTTENRLIADTNPKGNLGLANLLQVNSTFVANPLKLPLGELSQTNPLTFTPLSQNIAISIGDSSILERIMTVLNTPAQYFSAVGDLPAVTDTFSGYATQIIAFSTSKAEAVFQEAAYRKELKLMMQQKQSSISGVSEEEEFIPLLQYKAGYDAAARIISVIEQMLDTLMTIGRR